MISPKHIAALIGAFFTGQHTAPYPNRAYRRAMDRDWARYVRGVRRRELRIARERDGWRHRWAVAAYRKKHPTILDRLPDPTRLLDRWLRE